MKDSTSSFHHQLEKLGTVLGFEARREVANSVLALRLDGAYHPVVDLMWSRPLTTAQAAAIALVTGVRAPDLSHLPLVGIEVEGTTPSTKTMASDLANIAALGTRL